MRYHFDKPEIYLSLYGERYICEHPVYNSCTLYRIEKRGLAVIQQRFDSETKSTWWSEVDPWITDALYLHPDFREYFEMRLGLVRTDYTYCNGSPNYVGIKNETNSERTMGNRIR